MPLTFLASLLYVVLVFVLPGFIGIEMIAKSIGGPAWAWISLAKIAGLHAAVYFGIRVALQRSWNSWRRSREPEEEIPAWLWRIYHTVNRRGYRWLCLIGTAGLSTAAYSMYRHGAVPPSFWFLFLAVDAGLLDSTPVPDNLIFPEELGLPVPRFSFDTVPLEPSGDCRTIELKWQPWPGEDSQAEPIVQAFQILHSEYNVARGRRRYPTFPTTEYAKYIQNGLCESLKFVAVFIREYSYTHHLTPQQEINSVVSFVRSIPYATDDETRDCADWADFPIELLYDEKGDCEDHAILAAALLYWLGHDVGLFVIHLDGVGHVALACRTTTAIGPCSRISDNGHQYFYVETVPVNEAHRMGNMPAQFQAELAAINLILIEE
jgi:predicted transglutaminase-like cysteine proteinase